MLFVKTLEKKYMVGIDLNDDFCQISYCTDASDSITYSMEAEATEYSIPALLYKRQGEQEWICGKKAAELAGDPGGFLVAHLLEQAMGGRPVQAGTEEEDPCELLAVFLRHCLSLIGETVQAEQIAALMISVRDMNMEMLQVMEQLREKLPVSAERIFCEGHETSFYSYILLQEEELRSNGVLLFEYKNYERMRADRLIFNRRTTPVVGYVESKAYAALSPAPREEMDAQFGQIVQRELAANNYSSVYLIGDGFRGNWMKDSLRLLCRNSRVYLGNNLYSKGAAFSALLRERSLPVSERYFFLSDSRLKSNIGLKVFREGRESYYPLLDAGINWYEAEKTEDFILDGGNTLCLMLVPLTGSGKGEYSIRLDDLPSREDRMTRIRIHMEMKSADRVSILIEDLGFGEIFPSSGLRWEKGVTV